MSHIMNKPIRNLSNLKTTVTKLSAIALATGLLFTAQVNAGIADGKSKFLGNIIGNSVEGNFDTYWNQITLENAGKWEVVEPNQNQFSWNSNPNNILVQSYNKAQDEGYAYKHHTFIWANQSPDWINNLSANGQRGAIDNMMNAYFNRFPQTDLVDVVNEALDNHAPARGTHQDGSQGWMKFNGNNDIGKYSWIKWSFERAKAARDANGSNATLLINDYGIVNDDNATQDYIDLINAVNANGQLIEGIGVQAHFAFNLDTCGNYTLDAAQVKRNLDRLATTGLPIYVSEYDMNIGNEDEHDTKFMGVFRTFWDHPAVVGVTLWGYIRNQTWEPCTWLIDGNNERKALQSMRTYVQESTDGGNTGGNNNNNNNGGNSSGTIDNGGIYTVTSKHNMCVSVSGSSSANGANIVQSSCNGANNQKWKFNNKGNGFYELQAIHSNKCMDVAGISNSNGANIHQYDCSNGANQQWQPTATNGGKFSLKARHSDRCLDLAGGSNANGTNIQQYGCNARNTNQEFTLNKVN